MKIPKSFELGGMVWTVELMDDLGDLGRSMRDVQKIQVKKNEKIQTREQAFCHELVHAIKFTLGDADAHDEKEVDVLGTMFHQFLKTAKYR